MNLGQELVVHPTYSLLKHFLSSGTKSGTSIIEKTGEWVEELDASILPDYSPRRYHFDNGIIICET